MCKDKISSFKNQISTFKSPWGFGASIRSLVKWNVLIRRYLFHLCLTIFKHKPSSIYETTNKIFISRGAIELSFNTMGLFVWSWSFMIFLIGWGLQTISINFFLLWRMLGSSVEYEWRATYLRLLRASLGMPKWVWPSFNQYRMFIQTSTLPPTMQRKLMKHGRCCTQSNELPTKSLTKVMLVTLMSPMESFLDYSNHQRIIPSATEPK